jgi:endoglucanase
MDTLRWSAPQLSRRSGLVAVISSTIFLVWAGAAAAETAPSLTFLHTRGEDIVNEQGQKVLLRGLGLGNWFLPEGYMWKFGPRADRPRRIEQLTQELLGPEAANRFWHEFRRNYITQADIQRLAQLGYNSVRPALNARLFLTESGGCTGNEEGFVLLDNLVQWCKAAGVYVIVDMHAAPGGQTGANIDDSAADKPELFMEPKYETQLTELWQALARRYKDEPTVAGYDLLNEPLPERTGAAKAYKDRLEPLYQRLTKAIREIDPRHMIILEGADWANEWSVFTRPFDPNLVYEFHYYCWNNPTMVNSIQKYLDYRAKLGAPIWGGETGEKDDAIYWATTAYFEANNVGWSFWPWKKMDARNAPCSVKPPAGWAAVTAYSRGGAKPAREAAQQAFDELLSNIRLDNCVFNPDVVAATLRRVPARIEAANFDPGGQDAGYSVHEPKYRSASYRLSEAVPITQVPMGRWQTERYITLQPGEWTAYTSSSPTTGAYNLAVRVRAKAGAAQAQVLVGDQARTIKVSSAAWTEIKMEPLRLNSGTNRLKWSVSQGALDLEWLEFSQAHSE